MKSAKEKGKRALEKFSEGEVIELRFSELGDYPLRSAQSPTQQGQVIPEATTTVESLTKKVFDYLNESIAHSF